MVHGQRTASGQIEVAADNCPHAQQVRLRKAESNRRVPGLSPRTWWSRIGHRMVTDFSERADISQHQADRRALKIVL